MSLKENGDYKGKKEDSYFPGKELNTIRVLKKGKTQIIVLSLLLLFFFMLYRSWGD